MNDEEFEEQVKEIVNKLHENYPVLKTIEIPDGQCCTGCTTTDIGYQHGWEVAQAWEDLQTWYYVLDRDANGREKA